MAKSKKGLKPLNAPLESKTANAILQQMQVETNDETEEKGADTEAEKMKELERHGQQRLFEKNDDAETTMEEPSVDRKNAKAKSNVEKNVGLSVLIPDSLRTDINILCKLHDTKLAEEVRRLLDSSIAPEREQIESYKKLMKQIKEV